MTSHARKAKLAVALTVDQIGEKRRSKDFGSITAHLAAAGAQLTGTAARHIATIAEQIAAIGRGDFDAALAQASPDIELEIYAPPEFPFVRRATGIDALRQTLQQNFGALEEQQPAISNVITQGDVVVMFGTERGRIRSTGATYHVEFVHRFTFVDGALRNIRIIAARAI